MRNYCNRFMNCGRAVTESVPVKAGATEKFMSHIETFMPGNQSFNQSLYAPLMHLPLVCRPAVYFMRKVYMKR